jgi:hypothetical protein
MALQQMVAMIFVFPQPLQPIGLRFVKARFSHSGPHGGLDPLSGSLDLMADLLQQSGLVARPIGIDSFQQLLMVYSYQVLESRVCIWV